MGLPAVAQARRARSRRDSRGSPSAQSVAPVYGVRAEALAPNSWADFLLTVLDDRQGKVAEFDSEVRAPRPAPALARAQPPCPHA